MRMFASGEELARASEHPKSHHMQSRRPASSANFGFLDGHDPLLARLASLAELYCTSDPNTALVKLRQFGEALLQRVAAGAGVAADAGATQASLIRELAGQGVLPREVAELFHLLRQVGNDAVHGFGGTEGDAVHHLKTARELGIWFHRAFTEPDFAPGPFARPRAPDDPAAEARDQVEALRAQMEAERRRVEEAGLAAALAAELHREAERRARTAEEDREAAFALAGEMEELLAAERARMQADLAVLRAAAPSGDRAMAAVRARVQQAAGLMELDEAATRERIDQQLREAGWEADTRVLRHSAGIRPEAGRNLAIAEWPTASGPVDYVLFAGLMPLAAVEAKRGAYNVPAVLDQAARYSRDCVPFAGEVSPGGPWDGHRIPFLFATNGRPYIRQVQERSGVWFRDVRRPTNHARALQGWYSPGGLEELLARDGQAAAEALRQMPVDELPLRPYQQEGMAAVEEAILSGRRGVLVATATGTGKTRLAAALLYRLLEAGVFRRILFLVDRNALGEQAMGTFSSVHVEGTYTLDSAFEVTPVDEAADEDTVVHVSTVQGMVQRVLYAQPGEAPPVDAYDCVLVDECHRGYTLDREMSEAELTFRSEADYVSKYRRLIEYFDAVKIGLTATPAQHTTDIFGPPVYQYSYRQAVVDGYLVDHAPPTRIVTELAEDGITWHAGSEVMALDPGTLELNVFQAPDEIRVEVEDFNRRVVTENFNRVVCGELARHIDPEQPGKTLVFCVNDEHADRVVRLLKDAFAERYGEVRDDAVKKITGAAPRPGDLIRAFRNERLPAVAVTVDLLTTGIDVPEIVNLVFLRRVRSRILYEQMLGRATRLRPDLYGPGQDKTEFRVFDAVDLYADLQAYSDMRPVVVNTSIAFSQLAEEMAQVTDPVLRGTIRDQFVVRLRRARARLERTRGDEVTGLTGMSVGGLADHLAGLPADAAADFLAAHAALPALLDEARAASGGRVLISEHLDRVRRVELGFGSGQRPEDYLESFRTYVEANMNAMPALRVVLTRPRDLTRKQLRELALALDGVGYTEQHLRAAWRETTNQDIAASIIGYVRQAILREPLMAYEDRVRRAVARILASRQWTAPQRQWLERIGQQMIRETLVDREALDAGQFRAAGGGFKRINRTFDDQLDQILGELHDEVWRESA